MKSANLIDKAKQLKPRKVRHFPPDQLEDLAIAYFCGEITYAQASFALFGRKDGSNAVAMLGYGLRHAQDKGRILIKRTKHKHVQN